MNNIDRMVVRKDSVEGIRFCLSPSFDKIYKDLMNSRNETPIKDYYKQWKLVKDNLELLSNDKIVKSQVIEIPAIKK